MHLMTSMPVMHPATRMLHMCCVSTGAAVHRAEGNAQLFTHLKITFWCVAEVDIRLWDKAVPS